jgi:hypothetical protein
MNDSADYLPRVSSLLAGVIVRPGGTPAARPKGAKR